MAKKRKFTSLDDKCRVCLCDDGCMSDIFSEDLKTKIHDLGDSTSIHINNDENLPRNICHICLYKLDMWVEFKKQFLRSNTMLREHLGVGKLLDNATSVTKRKHSDIQESSKDNLPEDSVVKKIKSDEVTSVTAMDRVSANDETVDKSTNKEPISIEKTSTKNVNDNIELADSKAGSENVTRVGSPLKQIVGRRGKTTERRKASTKRWVARKKALLAATGENDTDTDSMSSDDGQLSPVQKARAKSNAEKVTESQRRITKSMKTFDSDVTDFYATKKTNDRANADNDSQKKSIDIPKIDEKSNDIEMKNATETKKSKDSLVKFEKMKKPMDNYLPHSVRSELIIDDATFVVTSTLVLTEPHRLNPVTMTNLSKESLVNDETNQERNTDIIDAVQLRRVCPKSPMQNDKKFIERCLNIEVEGTELEALQKVQTELANFVETKLYKTLNDKTETKNDKSSKNNFQTLDQQLKTIVEKSIKKNIETSRMDESSIDNRGNNTFTGEFVKAAMRSKIFQPRVLLVRYEGNNRNEEPRKQDLRAVNKKSLISSCKPNETSSRISIGKRRSIKPAKFADYDGSTFNVVSDDFKEVSKNLETSSGSRFGKMKTYGPALSKNASLTSDQRDGQKSLETSKALLTNNEKNPQQGLKTMDDNSSVISSTKNSFGEKHICGVCGETFGTRREVEIHFSAHKTPIVAMEQRIKQKMMRCKRCHEIVEARYVKLHVCHSPKNAHKCYTCEATFRNDKLLVKHLETHSIEDKKTVDAIPSTTSVNLDESITTIKQSTKDTSGLTKKRNVAQVSGKINDTYTCFVCDKIFEDEEVLKDHLQKHCDDISEVEDGDDDEEPNCDDKERYQCAICGESMESEDALESHVEKHLFDDEDDNPNLISIDRERTKKNDEIIHDCAQCSETFDSEMLLMLHMQAHEEEVAIAEWERRGVDNSQVEQHICVICDELYSTEAELSEHLDIHNGNAHVCLLCDKPFLTLEELQSHVNTH